MKTRMMITRAPRGTWPAHAQSCARRRRHHRCTTCHGPQARSRRQRVAGSVAATMVRLLSDGLGARASAAAQRAGEGRARSTPPAARRRTSDVMMCRGAGSRLGPSLWSTRRRTCHARSRTCRRRRARARPRRGNVPRRPRGRRGSTTRAWRRRGSCTCESPGCAPRRFRRRVLAWLRCIHRSRVGSQGPVRVGVVTTVGRSSIRQPGTSSFAISRS